jgi:uncharacterized protein (DUF885 family)
MATVFAVTGDIDSSNRRVDAIADRYVEEFARLHPVMATMVGVAGHDAEMTDYSPLGFEARAELLRSTLADLEAAEAMDERERVAKESMLERLGLELEMHDAGIPLDRINVIDSPLQETRQVFDLMPTDTEQDWRNIASRLALVPATLGGYRETLTRARDNGRVSAARQVRACAEQCISWTRDDSDFFAGLISNADVPAALEKALTAGALAAREAVADFGTFLDHELAPHAPSGDAVGRENYALASRYFLGATVDLDETYAWGWQELNRIQSDMQATADRILPGASVDEAIEALDADAARRVDGKESFRQWMQRLADQAIADLTDTHFDIPEPIRTIECCIAPTTDGGIYYTGPSEDFGRPGRMWWAVPEGVDSFSTWREVTTVFHEGVPGHHLQIAQTVYRSELLNRWQRLLCWVSGHGEGWALYAERLMDDLGYLSDPGDRMGMLAGQAVRAVRVIVDIGMHLELEIPADNPVGFRPGEQWTPGLGLEFMQAFSRMDDASLPFELNRYLGWPGQAPSYKVGERIWLAARAAASERSAGEFDLEGFHRAALDLGSLGLDPLRNALARL